MINTDVSPIQLLKRIIPKQNKEIKRVFHLKPKNLKFKDSFYEKTIIVIWIITYIR